MTRERRRELEARIIAKRRNARQDPAPLVGTVRGLSRNGGAGGPGPSLSMRTVTSPWCGEIGVQVRRRP